MSDHAPSAADEYEIADKQYDYEGDNSLSRPPQTPTSPISAVSGSLFTHSSPGRPSTGTASLTRSFNLHAIGINTSPLDPLGRRILFYEGHSGEDEDEDDGPGESSLDHLEEELSNDGGSSIIGGGHYGGWQASEDGNVSSSCGNGCEGLDDPAAIEDRKDVLIDRLNDMVRHVTSYAPPSPSMSVRSVSTWNSPGKSVSAISGISGGDSVAAGGGGRAVFTELHAHIDQMEAVLAAERAAEAAALAASPRAVQRHHRYHSQPNNWHGWQRPDSRSATGKKIAHTRRLTLGASPVLYRNQSAPLPEVAESSPTRPTPWTPQTRRLPTVSSAMAANCDALAGDLSAVLGRLLKRREESDIIQESLLQKLAAANHRTAELEAQIKALKDERNRHVVSGNYSSRDSGSSSGTPTETSTKKSGTPMAGESLFEAGERLTDLDELRSELSFLRLQLRGIEVQCRSYIPIGADPELTESIENWKADWFALRDKVDEERRYASASVKAYMRLPEQDRSIIGGVNSTF
ncbi:hypothetical protein SEPCBS119000_002556 [Sporothrix epigloea]|uniref:Uncharacterized protein n=1 Tax=Sporothrix epigloea TaxID=1892477 RepID=A0ABP0DGQ4_9PEZI